MPFVKKYGNGPNYLNELREKLRTALEQEQEEKRIARQQGKIGGVADSLKCIKDPSSNEKQRIVLNNSGTPINGAFSFWTQNEGSTKSNELSAPNKDVGTPSTSNASIVNGGNVTVLKPVPLVIRTQSADELAGAVAHPTKPSEIRKLIRTKMIRCRICKNRFLEKHLYERHLRDKHPTEHLAYLIQQEEEMQQQRREEFEANRLDEIVSGGFIPPEEDLDASKYEVDVGEIPLPGELTGGVPARFDRFGVLYQPKRVYKKKVSPQCAFCDKRYRNEHSLKKHIAKKHSDCVEWVQCLKCFKAVPSKAEMPNHLCEMVYMCFECVPARNLCTELRLFTHRAKFHRGQNSGFKCNLCNQKFLTPRKLRKHKKMSHVFTKTYQCHFCEELFISETAVTTHERVHTGIIKFECKICDFKCNRYLNMEEHRKEEHGYLCSICQGKLCEWGDLKNHMLIEHGGYLSSEFNSGQHIWRYVSSAINISCHLIHLFDSQRNALAMTFHIIYCIFKVLLANFKNKVGREEFMVLRLLNPELIFSLNDLNKYYIAIPMPIKNICFKEIPLDIVGKFFKFILRKVIFRKREPLSGYIESPRVWLMFKGE